MTLNDLQKAALVLFAAKEAGNTGSLAAMKGICYVIRNRVRAGWHDGSWIDVIENANDYAGNVAAATPRLLTLTDRGLQMLARDIDNLFYSGGMDDEVAESFKSVLYWQHIDRMTTPWFFENIIRNPANHRRAVQVGTIAFFE